MSFIFNIAKAVVSGLWTIFKPYGVFILTRAVGPKVVEVAGDLLEVLATTISGEEPICLNLLKVGVLAWLGFSKKRKTPAPVIRYSHGPAIIARRLGFLLIEKRSRYILTPRGSIQAAQPISASSTAIPRPHCRVRKSMVTKIKHLETPIVPVFPNVASELAIVGTPSGVRNRAIWLPQPIVLPGLSPQVAPSVLPRLILSSATAAALLAFKTLRKSQTVISCARNAPEPLSDGYSIQTASGESLSVLDLGLASGGESCAPANRPHSSVAQVHLHVSESLILFHSIEAGLEDLSMDTTLVEEASYADFLSESLELSLQHDETSPQVSTIHNTLTGRFPPTLVPSADFVPSITFKEAESRFCTEKALVSTLARHQLTVRVLDPKATAFVPSAHTKKAIHTPGNAPSKPSRNPLLSGHAATNPIKPSGKPLVSPFPKKAFVNTHQTNKPEPLKNMATKPKPRHITPPSINTRRVTIEGLAAAFGGLPRAPSSAPMKKVSRQAEDSSACGGPATLKSSPRPSTPYRTPKRKVRPEQRAPTCSACKSRPSICTATPTPAR